MQSLSGSGGPTGDPRVNEVHFQPSGLSLQKGEAAVEGFAEANLLAGDDLGDFRRLRAQFRIRIAHRIDDALLHLREKRTVNAEIAPVARSTPDDAAHHVLAIAVAGRQPLRREETHRARMVRDRAKRNVEFPVLSVARSVTDLARHALDALE